MATTLKNKKQILDLLDSVDDSASSQMRFIVNNWDATTNERFTPERFANRLFEKARKCAALDLKEKARRFADTAIQIL